MEQYLHLTAKRNQKEHLVLRHLVDSTTSVNEHNFIKTSGAMLI